ncbi:MAG: vanadium-dependent haloperoxidase, partial [Acidobacteriaceae bacterium]|nr:vanadium-dependent haloperoxidase [Acidobacteriaceae bacterium]
MTRRILLSLVFLYAGAQAQVTLPPPPTAVSANPVVQWNRNLLALVRTPGAQPGNIHPTHSFALMHAAIYDAVNAIDQTHRPYLATLPGAPATASQDAAAAAAAHDTLAALYPQFQSVLDRDLQDSLALLGTGPDVAAGMQIGANVAAQILAIRSTDGASSQPGPVSVTSGNVPGGYESTPPNFPKAQFTTWGQVKPFALTSANQFRPGPPPALTDPAYTADFNEIKSLGIAHSSAATIDQALTGRFWNGPIQNYWNEIAQTAALAGNLNTAQTARLFALLNISVADSVISFYDAKYTYNFWRPITAIRAAATDGNPDT